MTEIMPFPENNYETVLLDRPFGRLFFVRCRERIFQLCGANFASDFVVICCLLCYHIDINDTNRSKNLWE